VDGWVKVAFSCPSILSYHIISYRTWERRRLWLLGGVGMFGMVVVVVVVDVGWSPLVRSGIRRRRGANYVSFFIYNSHDQIGWVGYPTYLRYPPVLMELASRIGLCVISVV